MLNIPPSVKKPHKKRKRKDDKARSQRPTRINKEIKLPEEPKVKRKPGRPPTKFCLETCSAIIQTIRTGVSYDVAAASAGIDRDTLKEWMKRGSNYILKENAADTTRNYDHAPYGTFVKEVRIALAEAHKDRIQFIASSPDWRAHAWWLERRFKDEYNLAQKTEITGRDGNPIQTQNQNETIAIQFTKEDFNKLPIETVEALIEMVNSKEKEMGQLQDKPIEVNQVPNDDDFFSA